jgi:hypothetical protein
MGGLGQTITQEEQSAGSNARTELSQDDPVPQTVMRVAIKPDAALLVNVPLKFGKSIK